MDLTLHIGLPKTATTTLQRHLLAGTAGYLGKDGLKRCLSGTNKEVKELRDIATRHPFMPRTEVHSRTERWVQHVRRLGEKTHAPDALSLSEEGLSRWFLHDAPAYEYPVLQAMAGRRPKPPRTDSFPVARFLEEYLEPAWRSLGSIRVVLTLRNQSDYLASLYAQRSAKVIGASQRNFEQQVLSLIDSNDPSILWHTMIQALDQAIGRENVEVLLFEDMASPDFWLRFGKAMGIDCVGTPTLASGSAPRENVKAGERKGAWRIQRTKYKRLSSLLEESWPRETHPLARRMAIGSCKRVIDHLAKPALNPVLNRFRGELIELTPQFQARIREHCAESNQCLAERLGRTLEPLGY